MRYKLNPAIGKITSSLVLIINGSELEFENGEEAVNHDFEKNYIVDSMYARNNKVVAVLKESEINNTNWVGEEQVSFF